MSETVAVEFMPERGPRRRIEFRERSVGGYVRVEMHDRDGCWQPVGSEIVARLEVNVDAMEVHG